MTKNGYLGTLELNGHVRLLLLRPTPPYDGDERPRPLAALPYLMPNTCVDLAYCHGAPRAYETQDSCAEVAPLIVNKAKEAEAQGYHVMVVACMVDPGVAEATRAVRMPVVGLGKATRSIAHMVGDKQSTIYPRYIRVLELANDEKKTYRELLRDGRRRIQRHGADVLVPNCAYLGRLAHRLQADLAVPVLPNEDIALKLAELIALFGLGREEPWVEGTRVPRFRRMIGLSASKVRRLISPWVPGSIRGLLHRQLAADDNSPDPAFRRETGWH